MWDLSHTYWLHTLSCLFFTFLSVPCREIFAVIDYLLQGVSIWEKKQKRRKSLRQQEDLQKQETEIDAAVTQLPVS